MALASEARLVQLMEQLWAGELARSSAAARDASSFAARRAFARLARDEKFSLGSSRRRSNGAAEEDEAAGSSTLADAEADVADGASGNA